MNEPTWLGLDKHTGHLYIGVVQYEHIYKAWLDGERAEQSQDTVSGLATGA